MKNELKKLDIHLREKRPGYYRMFHHPLTENEILGLEKKYDIKLPNDLKELYKWKNGQQPGCFESFVNNSIFEALENVLSVNKEFTEMIGSDFEIENWWNGNWLPFFSDGGGSHVCYD